MKVWPLPPSVDVDDLPPKEKEQVNCLQVYSEAALEEIRRLQDENAHLKDNLAIAKGEKKRPVFKPSRMNEDAGKAGAAQPGTGMAPGVNQVDGQGKGQEQEQEQDPAREDVPNKPRRACSAQRSKTAGLKIDRDCIIKPTEPIPLGSRFKGYRDFTVQDILIAPLNTRFRLELWVTPDGRSLKGALPVAQRGCHFGPDLVSLILYQHHHCQVTQPLLHEQLREWGIDISSGQVDALLQKDKDPFHEEKDALLSVGLRSAPYVTVDDTGARHNGCNNYVTHIGNEHFAWFQTTASKSRVNFLGLLRAGHPGYRINEKALAYMREQKLPTVPLDALREHEASDFADTVAWEAHMDALAMSGPRHRRIATEGALLGSLSGLPIAENLAIISDDAGQFNVLIHGLCWIHAERLVHKMLPLNDQHRTDIAHVRSQIWELYASLKAYKAQPLEELKDGLKKRFDEIFTQTTSYTSLNLLLRRLHNNKSELLLVLDRPEIPLHTNGSEGDIRDFVKRNKVSGGTRSESGRRCRDTFVSLKKTCRKLGISFWKYLTDRVSHAGQVPSLPSILEQRFNYA